MARYRSTKDGWVNIETGETLLDDGWRNRPPCMPMVINDMAPITSPIDGKLITSRSQLRYELEKHGKRIIEPSESPTQGKIRNAKFAAKRGLKLSDEFRDYDSSMRKTAK